MGQGKCAPNALLTRSRRWKTKKSSFTDAGSRESLQNQTLLGARRFLAAAEKDSQKNSLTPAWGGCPAESVDKLWMTICNYLNLLDKLNHIGSRKLSKGKLFQRPAGKRKDLPQWNQRLSKSLPCGNKKPGRKGRV
ncbi:MAG: hypothetical protein WBF87_12410 [Mesorhizobium sp.]